MAILPDQASIAAIFESELPPRARLIALELVGLVGGELPLPRIASSVSLAARTGLTAKAIQGYLPDLVRAGLVAVSPTVVRGPEVVEVPDGDIPAALRAFIFERDRHTCRLCGASDDLTVDHIWPQSLGGDDELDNLRTLCRSCNSKKGARV